MALDYSDAPGWPASPTRVAPGANLIPDWRIKYNEARRQRRREQCRAAHKRWLEKTKEQET
jgi:hypothetical protein